MFHINEINDTFINNSASYNTLLGKDFYYFTRQLQ